MTELPFLILIVTDRLLLRLRFLTHGDSFYQLTSNPCAPMLLEILHKRGYTRGWDVWKIVVCMGHMHGMSEASSEALDCLFAVMFGYYFYWIVEWIVKTSTRSSIYPFYSHKSFR